MKPGTYIARVIEYSLPARDPGKEQVCLVFEIPGGEKITWRGNFSSEAAVAYTLKSLLNAGFLSNDLWKLLEPNAFDSREVEIVVEDDVYNGKTTQRVKYINVPRKNEDMATAQTKFSKFSGMLNSMRAGKPIERELMSDGDVPF